MVNEDISLCYDDTSICYDGTLLCYDDTLYLYDNILSYGAGAYPGFSSRRVKGYVGRGAKVQESAKVTLHLFSKRKFLAVFLYEER